MSAYYNENDPFAAEMLRNLIAAGQIAPGDVDDRDIRDVTPDDIREYTQCHFFAGVGIWSLALRRSGWPDDKPVWTGSCPCQPFSAAGKSGGFDDERHLWPAWHWLIEQCRPAEIFGEQVASKSGLAWFDLVSADLESKGYAVAAADLCAAGVGTPGRESRFIMEARHGILGCAGICPDPVLAGHIRDFADDIGNTLDGGHHLRQRLYWYARNMADSINAGPQGLAGAGNGRPEPGRDQAQPYRPVATSRAIGIVADNPDGGREGRAGLCDSGPEGIGRHESANGGSAGQLANAEIVGRIERGQNIEGSGKRSCPERVEQRSRDNGVFGGSRGRMANADGWDTSAEWEQRGGQYGLIQENGQRGDGYPDADNGGGRPADWLYGRDGVWRPVEPGTFPLAHGSAARVGRLRAYGNGLDFETAKTFIAACMQVGEERDTGSALADLL